MEETRVEKYREYRKSVIKDGSVTIEKPQDSNTENVLRCTTSTLPIDEVLKAVDSDEKERLIIKKRLRKKLMTYIGFACALTLLFVGLIIFGILVWR